MLKSTRPIKWLCVLQERMLTELMSRSVISSPPIDATAVAAAAGGAVMPLIQRPSSSSSTSAAVIPDGMMDSSSLLTPSGGSLPSSVTPRPAAAEIHARQSSADSGLGLSLCVTVGVICFKSSKPIQIGLFKPMSLSIHLHCLHLSKHLDICQHNYAVVGFCGQPYYCHRPYYSQVSISLIVRGLWWTISRRVKAHVVLTCANGFSPNHLPVIVASDRPWTTLLTLAHKQNLKAD